MQNLQDLQSSLWWFQRFPDDSESQQSLYTSCWLSRGQRRYKHSPVTYFYRKFAIKRLHHQQSLLVRITNNPSLDQFYSYSQFLQGHINYLLLYKYMPSTCKVHRCILRYHRNNLILVFSVLAFICGQLNFYCFNTDYYPFLDNISFMKKNNSLILPPNISHSSI